MAPVRQARRDGCRVVLSGHGGEQVLSGDAYARPALLGDVARRDLRRETVHFSRATGRSAMWLLPYAFAGPYVPARLCRALGKRRDRLEWLAAPSAASVPLPDPFPPQHLATETARAVYRHLTGGVHSARLASQAAMADHAGVEWRLPFLDLELVEFVLGLPAGLAFRDGQTQRLLRLAMRGVLPERIHQRRRSAEVSNLTETGLTVHGRGRIMDSLANALTTRDGLTSYSALLMAWTSYWEAPAKHSSRPLVAFLLVEAWLRHYENDAASTDSREHIVAAM